MSPSTAASPTSSLSTIGAFAGIYIIWGTTYLAIAFAIQTIPPFISGGMRFLTAAALMYAWLRWRSPQPFAGVSWPAAALCGVLLSGIGNGFVVWAQQGIPSGIAALIVTSAPIAVLVLDWAFFSRKAPTRQALLGIALAVAGVVTIVAHTRSLSGAAQPLYLVAMFVATIGWAYGTLLQKRAARAETVLSFTCAQMLFGALFQLAMSFLTDEWLRFDVSAVSVTSVLAVLYLIAFGSIIALNCYLWLLTHTPAPKVATYALVNPVVALILGALVLNERLTALAVGAAALVLLGVALVLFQSGSPMKAWRARRAKNSAVEVLR